MKIFNITPIEFTAIDVINGDFATRYNRYNDGKWTVFSHDRDSPLMKEYDVVDFLAKDLEELYQRKLREKTQ